VTAFLGIDAGTTAIKALLFDLSGQILGSGAQEYELLTPAPDVTELPAETYWQACCDAIRQAVARSHLHPDEIVALAISSQGETLVCVDEAGVPLRQAIVWLDNRASREAEHIESVFGVERVFAHTGQPEIVPTWPACKILWLRQHEPDTFRHTAKYLLLEDYLLFRLTGQYVAEKGLHTSTLLLDVPQGAWWTNMFDFLDISPEKMGTLMEPGQVVGTLSASGAAEAGLSTNTTAVTGSMDQTAGAVGAGNLLPGIVSEATGGALALCATLPGFTLDPQQRIATHYHALPETYCLLPFGQTAGMALRWFRDRFCAAEVAAAQHAVANVYDLLTAQAATIPAGSDGLVFLPHLMGAASPEFDPAARGVFYGIEFRHGHSHFLRAILESVAYMLRKNLEIVESIGGPASSILSMGGGARSHLWLSIKADVLQRPIIPVEVEEAASLGAAAMAATATGHFPHLSASTAAMTRLADPIQPSPANAQVYEQSYAEYLDLYDTLAPMFRRSHERRNPAASKS
jgi:xylulokinase